MENDDVIQHLSILHKVSRALLDGLKTSVIVMEQWDELSKERRESMISMINGLIEQGEIVFEEVPDPQ